MAVRKGKPGRKSGFKHSAATIKKISKALKAAHARGAFKGRKKTSKGPHLRKGKLSEGRVKAYMNRGLAKALKSRGAGSKVHKRGERRKAA